MFGSLDFNSQNSTKLKSTAPKLSQIYPKKTHILYFDFNLLIFVAVCCRPNLFLFIVTLTNKIKKYENENKSVEKQKAREPFVFGKAKSKNFEMEMLVH